MKHSRNIKNRQEEIKELLKKEGQLEQIIARFQMEYRPVEEFKALLKGYEQYYTLKEIKAKTLFENPYLKNIQIESWQEGKMHIDTSFLIPKKQIFSSKEVIRDPKTLRYFYEFGMVSKDVYLPTLYETKNNIWMSVEPSEINSFAPFLNIAHGNILIIGCGLGYLAYMLSEKNNVNKITIIEKDANVLKLFCEHILPQFKNRNKINVMQLDGLEYLEIANLTSYDFCSVDIWHNLIDMVPLYLDCLRLEKKHPTTKFHYWLEPELLAFLDRVFMETFAMDGEYVALNPKDIFSKMCRDIFASQPIRYVEEAQEFLIKNKKILIQEWAINHPEEIKKYQQLLEHLKDQKPDYQRKKSVKNYQ